eukprot:COSAG03_NODE_13184_length_513_cov_1.074879_1_plen_65_part_10
MSPRPTSWGPRVPLRPQAPLSTPIARWSSRYNIRTVCLSLALLLEFLAGLWDVELAVLTHTLSLS